MVAMEPAMRRAVASQSAAAVAFLRRVQQPAFFGHHLGDHFTELGGCGQSASPLQIPVPLHPDRRGRVAQFV